MSQSPIRRVVARSALPELLLDRPLADERRACPHSLIALVHVAEQSAMLSAAHRGAQKGLGNSPLLLASCALHGKPAMRLAQLGRFLVTHRPGGAIILPPLGNNQALIGLCAEHGCSAISLTPEPLDQHGSSICSNEREAAAEAVAYLIGLGHQRIGFVAGPESCRASRERELGYIDALAERGLDRGADLVASGNGSRASGEAAGHLLLDVSPMPGAIFASCDEMAAGVLNAARRRGLAVPRDLSVMGFGDSLIAAMLSPPLASVRVPYADMVRAAAMKLAFPDWSKEQVRTFRCTLSIRDSVAPPMD